MYLPTSKDHCFHLISRKTHTKYVKKISMKSADLVFIISPFCYCELSDKDFSEI